MCFFPNNASPSITEIISSHAPYTCIFGLVMAYVPVKCFSHIVAETPLQYYGKLKVACSRTPNGGGRYRTQDLTLRRPVLYNYTTAPLSGKRSRLHMTLAVGGTLNPNQPTNLSGKLDTVYMHVLNHFKIAKKSITSQILFLQTVAVVIVSLYYSNSLTEKQACLAIN